MTIRVVLADDHPLFLDGLDQLLRVAGDFDVVARTHDGAQALAAVERHRPDLLVIDLRMPGMDGMAALRELRARGLDTRVVVLTAILAEKDLLEAMRLGVKGAMLKEMPPRLMLECLHKVYAGGQWVEKRAVQAALEAAMRREAGAREVSEVLTPREVDLVRMVAEGLRNKEIAERLCITEGTVKTHLSNIYKKLGIETRVGVRRYAEEKGLI